MEQLLIFMISTFQSFRLVEDPNFHCFLSSFSELVWVLEIFSLFFILIQSNIGFSEHKRENGQSSKPRDILPSAKTIAARLDIAVEDGLNKLKERIPTIAALTLDFAKKKEVDFLAVTGHRISEQWFEIFQDHQKNLMSGSFNLGRLSLLCCFLCLLMAKKHRSWSKRRCSVNSLS